MTDLSTSASARTTHDDRCVVDPRAPMFRWQDERDPLVVGAGNL